MTSTNLKKRLVTFYFIENWSVFKGTVFKQRTKEKNSVCKFVGERRRIIVYLICTFALDCVVEGNMYEHGYGTRWREEINKMCAFINEAGYH